VIPGISKVIFICELELLPRDDQVQSNLLLINEIVAQHIRFSGDDAVAIALYLEPVQMIVLPAHDLLENLVKLEWGYVSANLNSPPDGRPYSIEGQLSWETASGSDGTEESFVVLAIVHD
jgi:hypothetical protein